LKPQRVHQESRSFRSGFRRFGAGALAFGYLLAETPYRPAGDNGSSSVRIVLPDNVRAPAGSPKKELIIARLSVLFVPGGSPFISPPLSDLFDEPCRSAAHDRIRRYVFRHDRSGGDLHDCRPQHVSMFPERLRMRSYMPIPPIDSGVMGPIT